MNYTTNESDEAVVLEPSPHDTASKPDAAVIWLHGLGADGHDFVPIVPELRIADTLRVRFIFPHARIRPVTINNGYEMRAWYDITSTSLERREDEKGIRESENVVRDFIQRQLDEGIAAHRIVIAGFSQGGAIALQAALRYPQRLAGAMALSTYLPLSGSIRAEASQVNRDLPILMCHGSRDGVVPPTLGETSRDLLVQMGYAVEWKTYPMEHSVCVPEIGDIASWLGRRLAVA